MILPRDLTELVLEFIEAKAPDEALPEIVEWARLVRRNFLERTPSRNLHYGSRTEMWLTCAVARINQVEAPLSSHPLKNRWDVSITLKIDNEICIVCAFWQHWTVACLTCEFERALPFSEIDDFSLIDHCPREIEMLPSLIMRPHSYMFKGHDVFSHFSGPNEANGNFSYGDLTIDEEARQDMTSDNTFFNARMLAYWLHLTDNSTGTRGSN